jgi:hypothetical protein
MLPVGLRAGHGSVPKAIELLADRFEPLSLMKNEPLVLTKVTQAKNSPCRRAREKSHIIHAEGVPVGFASSTQRLGSLSTCTKSDSTQP